MSAGSNNRSTYISYDRNGFMINGKPVFLVSGSMHYFRVPRDQWAERFEMARQFGLNCIETYVAWNVHEGKEGIYDFVGNADLEAFLEMAHAYGLYAIVRPGPYICAEWDFGGFPSWFLNKKGIKPRRLNGPYMVAVKRWMDVLLKRLRKHLITQSGSVIMVQVENELANIHLTREHERAYMRELVKTFYDNDIDVPLISCEGGLDGALECINAYDPATRFGEYRTKYPDIPLMATEFWSDWYLTWDREHPENVRLPEVAEHATWKSIAHGGAGYNYYMWHGGTNFGYTSMYLQTTSYFDGAPLNENGLLNRNGRFTRKVALFADAAAEILAGSVICSPPQAVANVLNERAILGPNVPQEFDWSKHGKVPFPSVPFDGQHDLACWARTNKGSTILFLENLTDQTAKTVLQLGDEEVAVSLKGHQFLPIIHHFPSETPVHIHWICGRLVTKRTFGNSEWIVVAGPQNDKGYIQLSIPEDAVVQVAGSVEAAASKGNLKLTFTFSNKPGVVSIQTGNRKLFLAALDESLADGIWFLEHSFVLGARHVQISTGKEARVWTQTEQNLLFSADKDGIHILSMQDRSQVPPLPVMTNWQAADAVPEAAEAYDDEDGTWTALWEPEEMTSLGCHYGYGWYRTTIASAKEGEAHLFFSGYADRLLLFVNGTLAGISPQPSEDRKEHPAWGTNVQLRKGKNVIAVLADNLGKVKGDWQLGMKSMDHEAKGLFGSVHVNWNARFSITDWKFRASLSLENRDSLHPSFDKQHADALVWLDSNAFASRPGTVFKAKFHLNGLSCKDYNYLKIRLTGMTKGILWVNGVNLGRYWTENRQTDYVVPSGLLKEENEMYLFEEISGDISTVCFVYDTELSACCLQKLK